MRGGICMYCGYAFKAKSLDPEDIAVVYEQLIAHDKQCSKNPLVKRIADLEVKNERLDALAIENKRLKEAISAALEFMDEEPAKDLLEQTLKDLLAQIEELKNILSEIRMLAE